jgi:glycosyltransferase involved in cell wall biosynthesis
MSNSDLMFSIVIPTYNRAKFILKAVESYLQQDYPNFEIIVVDDGSTDNTKEVLSAVKDGRVSYYRQANAERGAARNFGVLLASGDYINFCDSDDYVLKHHLSVACKIILNHNLPVFHIGHNIVRDNQIEFAENRTGVLNEYVLEGNTFILNSVFIRKQILLENPFVEDRDLAGSEDWLQWLMLSANYDIQGFEDITSVLVQHKGRSMLEASGEKTLKRIKLVKKYLEESITFQNKYGNKMPVVLGSGDLLIALDFALEKKKWQSLKFFVQSLSSDPSLIFSRRVLAVLKYLLLRW